MTISRPLAAGEMGASSSAEGVAGAAIVVGTTGSGCGGLDGGGVDGRNREGLMFLRSSVEDGASKSEVGAGGAELERRRREKTRVTGWGSHESIACQMSEGELTNKDMIGTNDECK